MEPVVLETGPTKHPFSPSHEVCPRSCALVPCASRIVTPPLARPRPSSEAPEQGLHIAV